jgi:endothelin-converting enzyme
MTLWFWQPDLGLPSKVSFGCSCSCNTANFLQEYYEEDDIGEVYRKALEQLLFIVFDDEKPPSQSLLKWPPIPWPPWGDDDDGKAENSTVRAKRLSKEVLKFEKKIARASQDLYAVFSIIDTSLTNI